MDVNEGEVMFRKEEKVDKFGGLLISAALPIFFSQEKHAS